MIPGVSAWVKVENSQNTETKIWGPIGPPVGPGQVPWPGVQGAGGPRKLLHFILFETKKSILLSLKTPVFFSDSKQNNS